MIPHRIPFFLPWLFPSLTWRIADERKALYLTFDDGPVAGPTEFVLDHLASASARATFFCIGDNIAKYPAIFRRIVANGHSVGNHTVNHLNGWKTTTVNYLDNVRAFDRITGDHGYAKPVRLFRPPYGRLRSSQIAAMEDYRIVMWDVLSQDYDPRLSPERCLRRTLAACRAGSIVVFHDSYKAERNMKYVLPRLLDHFGGKGFAFRNLEEPANGHQGAHEEQSLRSLPPRQPGAKNC